uniref:Uncharacterized protein n=2 Tax=Oryza TaxID=4527 RepID=A0A0D3HC53_9ORYZ
MRTVWRCRGIGSDLVDSAGSHTAGKGSGAGGATAATETPHAASRSAWQPARTSTTAPPV